MPMLFLCSLIIPSTMAYFYSPVGIVSLISLLLYVVLISLISLSLALKKKLCFRYLIIAFATLHLSYGWGSLNGIINVLKNGK